MKLVKFLLFVGYLIASSLISSAQNCNNENGLLVYEKVSEYRLSASSNYNNKGDRELITRTEFPVKVLEECIRRCQQDKVTAIEHCLSFDFAPGARRSSPFISGEQHPAMGQQMPMMNTVSLSADYEESQCIMYGDRAVPDGNENLIKQENIWHFNKICLNAKKLSIDCANRLYVFERFPGYRLEASNDKEIPVSNRTECEDKCLEESEFVCRSVTFDKNKLNCRLSRSTRYMNFRSFVADANAEYMENMCLKSSEICQSTVSIVEPKKELDGTYERELFTTPDVLGCSASCQRSIEERGYLCRSFNYDDQSHTCILYDEDPLFWYEMVQESSRTSDSGAKPLKSSPGNYYRIFCTESAGGNDMERSMSMTNATLECYRRKRLDGPHEVEITAYNFYDCLEECTRRYSRNCKSVEFSSSQRLCRFSSGDMNDLVHTNLIDDPSYDYYKFLWHRSLHDPPQFMAGPSSAHPMAHPMSPADYNINYGFQGPAPPPPHPSSADQHPLGQPPPPAPNPGWPNMGPWSQPAWRPDHHRGGFNFHRHSGFPPMQPSPNSPHDFRVKGLPPPGSMNGFAHRTYHHPQLGSHTGSFSESGYMPGGSHSPLNPPGHPGHPGQPPPPPSSPSMVGMPPQMGPGHGIPYHALGFPSLVHPNSIMPQFQGFSPEKCKFPVTVADGPQAAAAAARFNRIGFGARLRNTYIFKVVRAQSLQDCEKACMESRDFACLSFNYRGYFQAENCELSQYDSKNFKLDNPAYFEQSTQFDYYERDALSGSSLGFPAECLEVSQTCTPDGMEFSLKTPEGFYGRIYTYGFYDSCFYDGNGGTLSVLRISRANGFPRCGTQQYGDAMTNIVVVQFNDFVQTSRDKKYNLTCYFSGPGEAVVTSNYLDTKTDGRYPTQIEHLPAQNILTSNVVLRILYRGTPTNTIVVGDLLTFRLEARGHYRYDYFNSDISATNVMAKDPYTGRQVHLIDSRGCPVDLYVFPELHKTPDGALEAEFYAFKIPDSNFLVFQATVRTCRGPCEPVICTDRSRGPGSFPSWGRRRRRSVSSTESPVEENTDKIPAENSTDSSEDEEEVHQLLQVYLSREEIPSPESKALVMADSAQVCVSQSNYYGLITAITVMTSILMAVVVATFLLFKKSKMALEDAQLNTVCTPNLYVTQFAKTNCSAFDDPSEPIYTDPSLFERSRSLRSLTITNAGKGGDGLIAS